MLKCWKSKNGNNLKHLSGKDYNIIRVVEHKNLNGKEYNLIRYEAYNVKRWCISLEILLPGAARVLREEELRAGWIKAGFCGVWHNRRIERNSRYRSFGQQLFA